MAAARRTRARRRTRRGRSEGRTSARPSQLVNMESVEEHNKGGRRSISSPRAPGASSKGARWMETRGLETETQAWLVVRTLCRDPMHEGSPWQGGRERAETARRQRWSHSCASRIGRAQASREEGGVAQRSQGTAGAASREDAGLWRSARRGGRGQCLNCNFQRKGGVGLHHDRILSPILITHNIRRFGGLVAWPVCHRSSCSSDR